MFFRVSSLFSDTVLENQGYSQTPLPFCIEAANVFAGCAQMQEAVDDSTSSKEIAVIVAH